jgi:hypothetical protein
MSSAMNRWPNSAAQTQCVLCGQPKQPTLPMCIDCFQKNHVGKGQYTAEAIKRMNRAENNLAEDDPFDGIFDDGWDQMERDLGVKF